MRRPLSDPELGIITSLTSPWSLTYQAPQRSKKGGSRANVRVEIDH